MKTNDEIRRENIAILADKWGSNRALSEALGRDPAMISQWKNGHRNLDNDTARYIEETLGLERGWIDNDHSDPGVDAFRNLPKEVRAWIMRQGNIGIKPNGTDGE